jgi:hypothetical protein
MQIQRDAGLVRALGPSRLTTGNVAIHLLSSQVITRSVN